MTSDEPGGPDETGQAAEQAEQAEQTAQVPLRRRRLPWPRHDHEAPEEETAEERAEREREETLLRRFAQQWALVREERRAEPAPLQTGPSNFRRAEVPFGLDLAAGWAWRILVIALATYLLMKVVGFFAVVTLPLAVALLITALATPFVRVLTRVGVPRGLSSLIVVVSGFVVVGTLLTVAGQQIAGGASDLADSVIGGLEEIRTWLQEGPLNASESQVNEYLTAAQDTIRDQTRDGEVISQVTQVGAALGHVVVGFFIAVFATYFFLADGERIWSWLVRLTPRVARERVDSSGRVAWTSLVQFVRATVIVALVDATGIAVGAAILDVPFVLAIGVLTFLGAFVPMVGATVAGAVAVLVALVDQGPITALLMLAVVIGVQQLESNVLQPFLMGRWVALHPLGVIIAITGGVLVAGIAGALVAVPLAAAANAVVLHLAQLAGGTDPQAALAEADADSPLAGA